MTDERDLLERIAAGDDAAWAILIEKYERLVWSVIRSYRLGDGGSADVVQTVWLRLAQHAERIREPRYLATWLATTARNEALRVQKKLDRSVPVAEWEDEPTPRHADADAALIDEETIAEVHAAMRKLSDTCQQLLRLLTTDPPLDYHTIAEMLDRPIGSIGPTRQRCLDGLRKQLPT